jgi:hypothetical protein
MSTDQIITIILQTLEVLGVLGATYFAAKTVKLSHNSLIEQRESEEPEVVIFVKQSNNSLNIIDLVIRNEGIKSARNIKFKVIGKNITSLSDRKIRDISLLKNGIALLSGGQEVVQPLGVMLGDAFKEYKNANTKVQVTYSTSNGKKKSDLFILDFKGLIDRKLGKDNIESIADSLKDIQDELHSIKKDIHLVANNGITELFAQPTYPGKNEVTQQL